MDTAYIGAAVATVIVMVAGGLAIGGLMLEEMENIEAESKRPAASPEKSGDLPYQPLRLTLFERIAVRLLRMQADASFAIERWRRRRGKASRRP